MRLGILKTGAPPEPLAATFGGYPDMFRRLLGEDRYDYAVFDVEAGVNRSRMRAPPLAQTFSSSRR